MSSKKPKTFVLVFPKRKNIENEQEPDLEEKVQEPPTEVATFSKQEPRNLDTTSLAPVKNPEPVNSGSGTTSPGKE